MPVMLGIIIWGEKYTAGKPDIEMNFRATGRPLIPEE